jgi:tRNA U34 5-methylaminomethyl-2-thiouridine-forming methyltransferase MnmC
MPEIVTTEDGSITCLDAPTGELYHNRAGAYTEALENYVGPCALPHLVAKQTSLRVLDVCFGLGYNSFVLLQQLLELIEGQGKTAKKFCLDLLGLDRDPDILSLLPKVLANPKFDLLASELKRLPNFEGNSIEPWKNFDCQILNLGENGKLTARIELRLTDVRQELPKLVLECAQSFDFIFHDAFSPRRMPELWSVDLFAQYVKLLKPTGKIITYSSATAVRGAFRSLGLNVKRTAAVGGKSGGTVAAWVDDEQDDVSKLTAEEEKRLHSSSAVPYRDPTLSDDPRQILARREEEIAALRLAQPDQ